MNEEFEKVENNSENGSQKYKTSNKVLLISVIFCVCIVSLIIGGIGGGMLAGKGLPKKTPESSESSALPESSESSGASENSEKEQSSREDFSFSEASEESFVEREYEYSATNVVRKVKNSVVAINVSGTMRYSTFGGYVNRAVKSSGSGVIISENGYIITNHHVISGNVELVTVILTDGTEYEAEIVASDEKKDIALLKVNAEGLNAVTIGDSDKLELGDTAIVIGNPLGEFQGSVTRGIISGISRDIEVGGTLMENLIQTDAAINPGNSGGGLFNEKGELVGIIDSKSVSEEVEGLGFAIPSNDMKAVVNDLKLYGYVTGRPEVGFEMIDITSRTMALMYGVSDPGVYVYTISENSAAYAAGLRVGDRILAAKNYEISSGVDVEYILEHCNVGDTVTLATVRNGKPADISWTVREYVPFDIGEHEAA